MSPRVAGGSGPGAPAAGREALAGAALLALVLTLGVGIFDHEIWSPTEPAVAGVVWNMHAGSGLAVPRIGEFPYLEKPPGYAWLAFLATRVGGGLDAGWLRLPSALLGLGVLALLAWVVTRRHGPTLGALAVLLGATSLPVLELSHRASPDTLALFFAALAFSLHLRAVADGRPGRGADAALAIALGASFYAKNFLVLFTVVPPIAFHRLWMRDVTGTVRLGLLTLLATVALVAPWALALHAEGGDELLRVAFVDNTLGRFFDVAASARPQLGPLNDAYTAERDGAPWIYLLNLPAVAAPWTLLCIAALPVVFARGRTDEHRRFLGLALVLVPLVLTLSSSRNSAYLRPLVFVAVLVAVELFAARPADLRPWQRLLVIANLVVVVLAVTVLPLVLAWRFGGVSFAVLFSLCVAGTLALAWRQQGRLAGTSSLLAAASFATAGLAAALWLGVPRIDAERSTLPFFEEVRPLLEGRRPASTIVDDRRFPLLQWYLDRPVRALAGRAEALTLLAGDESVAVFASAHGYARTLRKWAGVPHRSVPAPSGKETFVLLLNDSR